MEKLNILIIGGGIGGLTSAIALGKQGHRIEIVERDPAWGVYGVGIIQQSNVVRAMAELGILDKYLDAAFGFDFVEVYLPDGSLAARIPAPRLTADYPAALGIRRPELHKVLGDSAIAAGARVRLGVTVTGFIDDGSGVDVRFSDESVGRFDIVVGADGLYSTTRTQLFPDAPTPKFTGQAVWRYNLDKPAEMDCLRGYEGPIGIGLVPLSTSLMYMYLTIPEPDNPRYPLKGLAEAMRSKIGHAAPAIRKLAEQITDDEAVVYKPLECIFLDGDWHKGRVVLIGDAVHAMTPHLGQGAGMAIEDSVVLAEELAKQLTPEAAFCAYRERRYERCKFIAETSLALCYSQLGKGPPVDQATATRAMIEVISKPI